MLFASRGAHCSHRVDLLKVIEFVKLADPKSSKVYQRHRDQISFVRRQVLRTSSARSQMRQSPTNFGISMSPSVTRHDATNLKHSTSDSGIATATIVE